MDFMMDFGWGDVDEGRIFLHSTMASHFSMVQGMGNV
jgi:hypothetical protein